MARYRLTLEYDGGGYSGWQRQANGRSIQRALEDAVARLDPSAPHVAGAGRTDAGVHARGQVAHVELSREWAGWRLRAALNAHLSGERIAVTEAAAVEPEFDARRSACARHYRYVVVNRRAPLVFERGRAWLVKKPLRVAAMHEAAQVMIGRHDFSTFRDAQCQANSPVRTLDYIRVSSHRLGAGGAPPASGERGGQAVDRLLAESAEGEEIWFEAGARSFLHRQVRSMVGSLVEVGLGKWRPADFQAAFAAADRSRCGPVAPPDGLYLERVDYPKK